MSSAHLCIPRNETVEPLYYQTRIVMFCPSSYTHICERFTCSRIGFVYFEGTHKWDFRCSVYIGVFLFICLEMYKHNKFQKRIDLENLGQLLNMDFQYVTWVQYIVEQEYLYWQAMQ
jgi:hypothetical protein